MAKDILLDENNDLLIQNGDFVIGQSDERHVKDIFEAMSGEYKEHPEVGFGADLKLKTLISGPQFKRELKVQLENDGYLNPKIDLSNGFEKLNIEV